MRGQQCFQEQLRIAVLDKQNAAWRGHLTVQKPVCANYVVSGNTGKLYQYLVNIKITPIIGAWMDLSIPAV